MLSGQSHEGLQAHTLRLASVAFWMPGTQPSRARILSARRDARSLLVSRWLAACLTQKLC
jgi:hypothetical protein